MRRAAYVGLAVVAVLLLLAAGLFGALQTGLARDQLRLWIADMTAGSATQVHVDAIEGLVPFDMRLMGLRLSDRQGVWATADRIDVAWLPQALLAGRVQIDELAADSIDLARLPATQDTQEAEPSGPLIPELPVAIDLRVLSIERLSLGAPVLGEPAALSLRASARLGEIRDGLSAALTVRQLSGNTGTATVDLRYRPDDDYLGVAAKVDEPRGGVLGRLLGLPRGSALLVALEGEGPLTAWHGRLDARLNDKPLLALTADIAGHDRRTMAFTLQAMPGDLLPEPVRPLVVGGVNAKGAFEIKSGGDVLDVSAFSAATAAGQVNASGTLGLNDPGDLAVTITLAGSQPFAMLAPRIAWSGATMRARLQGTIDKPHVTANTAVQDLAAVDLGIGASTLALEASAEQGLRQPITIRAELQMSDIATEDPRLAALLADGARLSLSGSADQEGTLVADRLEAHAGTIVLSGAGRAERWGAAAREAEARLTIGDIADVGAPLGVPGAGKAEFALKLEPAVGGDRLEVDGATRDLATGQPILDGLLGRSPRMHLALTANLPEEMTITNAQLEGAKARFDARGTVAGEDLDIRVAASLDDAAAIDPMLGGQVLLDGTIRGTLQAPNLVAELGSPAFTIAGRRLEQVRLSGAAANLLSNPSMELKGAATLERLPAAIAADMAVEGERIAASNLVLTLGQSRMAGDVAMTGGMLTGKIDFNAPDLRQIGRLAGVAMSGQLSATLQLDHADGRQRAALSARGREVSASEQLSMAGLELKARADDLFGAPVVTANLDIAQPEIADRPLSRISMTAKGPISALQTRASLTGADFAAAAEAEVAQAAGGYRIGLKTLTADVRDIKVKNERPATIAIGAAQTRIDGVALAVEDGSLRLDGTVAADQVELTAAIRSMPLSIVGAFAPHLPLTGRLDGDLQVSGAPATPSGRFTIAGRDIGASQVPEQQADLQIAGTLRQGRLDVDGTVKPKSGGALTFTAALPSLASDARLQAEAEGTFDLLLVDAFLAGGADRVRGKAELDMSAAGRLSAPELQGRIRLVDSAYENLRYGIELRQIAADLRASGTVIHIDSLSAATPGGGRISGEGQVGFARGVETALRIQARNATIMDTDLATATIDSDLEMSGDLASRLKLGGSVKVVRADIRVPDRLPPSVQEIEVTEVNAPPRVAARIAAREPPPRQAMIVDLDLAVDAPQQVAVRGRGLDVELGGAIQVGGTSDKPEIDGALTLRRGSLDIAGKRLDFTEGRLTFEGGDRIDPMLDLTAVTRAQDLEVTTKVEGPARAPRVTLSSVPTMPEDEILARMLFGKSVGALSPFELVQLAQATADLAGISSGSDVLERLRKSTGLDRLSLEHAEGAAGPSLSAGRYVAEGVYVGVSQGATTGSSAATVEIELTPNVKVESEIGANAAGKAGVNLEWDY